MTSNLIHQPLVSLGAIVIVGAIGFWIYRANGPYSCAEATRLRAEYALARQESIDRAQTVSGVKRGIYEADAEKSAKKQLQMHSKVLKLCP